jgi:hypothetical protein
MRSIRSKLTYANVMSTLAVFLVLTGGTAIALNGHNTVQSDDLGPGAQVKAPDVADNAINGANVVDNSLTGDDVNESSLRGLVQGRMLDFNRPAVDDGDPNPVHLIATVGPYQLGGQCHYNTNILILSIYAKGPAGFSEAEYNYVEEDMQGGNDHAESAVLQTNSTTRVLETATTAAFARDGGTLLIRSNSGTLVQVMFSAVMDKNASACHLWGMAVTG